MGRKRKGRGQSPRPDKFYFLGVIPNVQAAGSL
jgi:hypothetical protein